MKNRVFLILLSGLLLILSAAGFGWEKARNAAPVPKADLPGGYYDAPFTLTLSAPKNGTIYYTTDGSAPTRTSNVYHGGIEIYDRSSEPNVYNAVQNVVRDWQDFTPDPAPVPKGTVVRALFVNDRDIESQVLTQTYFVGIQPPERGCTLSLAFEPEDLFGEEGIYVTGREYDQWYLSGGENDPIPVSNFERHTEVKAVAEWIDPSGDHWNQPVGLRIQGASARLAPKKRFILTAREEYSGSNVFDKPLFGDISSHSVMLKDAVPDAIAYDLVSDRTAAVQQSLPVRVYLNGEYWYDTYMLERYDEQYFRQHYGVDNRLLVKDALMDEESAAHAEYDYYGDFMYWINSTDFTDPNAWQEFQRVADLQSYIDFLVTNYYLVNVDFSDNHNYVQWRSAVPGPTKYEDWKWRWCNFDLDVIENIQFSPHYIGSAAATNTFRCQHTCDISRTSHFKALKPNPEFRQQFVLSFMDMVNNNFSPSRVGPILNKYGYDLSWMEGFFLERPKYAAQHLAQEFNLTGTLETVTISANDPKMGDITVNTSRIDLEKGPWSGRYFTDYPITVTAEAKEGYRFLGWKGGTASPTLTLSVEGSPKLEAVFAKK